jgi:hypothetical protein
MYRIPKSYINRFKSGELIISGTKYIIDNADKQVIAIQIVGNVLE